MQRKCISLILSLHNVLGVGGNIQNVIKYYYFHSNIFFGQGSIRFKCPFKGYPGSNDRILFILFGTHCIYSCNIFNYTVSYQVVELSRIGGDSTTTSLTYSEINGVLYLTLTEDWPSVYIPYCLFLPGGTHTPEFYNMNFELA